LKFEIFTYSKWEGNFGEDVFSDVFKGEGDIEEGEEDYWESDCKYLLYLYYFLFFFLNDFDCLKRVDNRGVVSWVFCCGLCYLSKEWV